MEPYTRLVYKDPKSFDGVLGQSNCCALREQQCWTKQNAQATSQPISCSVRGLGLNIFTRVAPGCGSGVALSGHFANGRSPDGVAGADQVVDVPHVLLRKREVVVQECDVQLGEETCVQVANIFFSG